MYPVGMCWVGFWVCPWRDQCPGRAEGLGIAVFLLPFAMVYARISRVRFPVATTAMLRTKNLGEVSILRRGCVGPVGVGWVVCW